METQDHPSCCSFPLSKHNLPNRYQAMNSERFARCTFGQRYLTTIIPLGKIGINTLPRYLLSRCLEFDMSSVYRFNQDLDPNTLLPSIL